MSVSVHNSYRDVHDRAAAGGQSPQLLKQRARASAEELIEHCKAHLTSYKKPKSVEFRKELPKTPSGKILKRALREKYWAGQSRSV